MKSNLLGILKSDEHDKDLFLSEPTKIPYFGDKEIAIGIYRSSFPKSLEEVDIVFQNFDDGIVYLHMQGACSGCPSSTATLKMGIENMLKHYVPEVKEVRPVDA